MEQTLDEIADRIAETFRHPDAPRPDELCSTFEEHVHVCVVWTHNQLNGPQLDLLTELVLKRVGNGWRQ